jgi:hypothetical protein
MGFNNILKLVIKRLDSQAFVWHTMNVSKNELAKQKPSRMGGPIKNHHSQGPSEPETGSRKGYTTMTSTMTRGYVAVSLSFAASTTKVQMTARKDMVVQGENGASVTLKAGEKFTAVRSASLGPDMWYIVRNVSGEKKCSCPATKPCRHEKLVATQPVVETATEEAKVEPKQTYRIITVPGTKRERRDLLAEIEAKREDKFKRLGEIAEIKERKRSEDRMMSAPLTTNSGFHLMR